MIALNRPQVLNAHNETLMMELVRALDEARNNEEVRVSVGNVSGAGVLSMCFGTDDQKEGAKAFLEKRTPIYRGK